MSAPMSLRVTLQHRRSLTRLWAVTQPCCCGLQLQQVRHTTSKKKAMKLKKAQSAPKDTKFVAKYLRLATKEKVMPKNYDEFLKRVPEADIWIRTYYPAPQYTVAEALEAHREFACPEMLDNPSGMVTMKADLNMKAKKLGKFIANFKHTILLPHDFDDDTKPQILAFVKSQDEKEHAMAQGVALAGGVDLVKSIQDHEVYLADYDHIICTLEMLPEVATLRKTLKDDYPSKQKGSVSSDLDEMIAYFSRGKTYSSTKETEAIGKLEVNLGTLDMPTEHLIENFAAYIQALSRYRTSGRMLKRVCLVCPPSSERFHIATTELIPKQEEKPKKTEEKVEEEKSEMAEQEAKAAEAAG